MFSLHVHHCPVDANLLYSTTTDQEMCLMPTRLKFSHFRRITGRDGIRNVNPASASACLTSLDNQCFVLEYPNCHLS